MNTDFLSKLNQAYDAVTEKFKEDYRLNTIDTSGSKETTPESTAEEVVTQILDGLEERLK